MATADLTAARLRERLHYDPTTGVFTRIQGRYAGRVTGSVTHYGYLSIDVDGAAQRAHRLAWLYVYGSWPIGEVDHINGVRTDNRLSNLRDTTRSGNARNLRRAMHAKKSELPLGVFVGSSRKNPFTVKIRVDGARLTIGSFATADEASVAYIEAKRKHHETCTL